MARTTETLVHGSVDVIDSADTPAADLEPYILSANELVTEICGSAGYSDARLELIERWLSAHFYCVYDPRSQSESAGVSASYEGSAAMFLERTRYGQQAMLLDTAGGLARLNAQTKAGKPRGIQMFWAGSTPAQKRAVLDEDEDDE